VSCSYFLLFPNTQEREEKKERDRKTYPDLLVFGTSSKILAIWAEADTANVEISVLVNTLILESCYILTSSHIKDLSRSVAARGNIFPVATESNAADHAVVHQMVDELDIQDSLDLRVEDCIPVGPFPFLCGRQVIWIPVG
jgi:hypothetical protein